MLHIYVVLSAEQTVLDVFEAETVYCVRETLTGAALVAEQGEGTLDDLEHFLLARKYVREHTALRSALAPAAADIDRVAALFLADNAERALADTASAVVAHILVPVESALAQTACADGAGLFDLTDLAAAAFGEVVRRHALADDAKVVQIGLDAVVRAAADGDLELVRQPDVVPALVEALVDGTRKRDRVDQTVLAGRALAGDDGANLRAGAAGLKTVLREEGAERLDIGERDALHLDGQTGGHGDLAAAELLCRVYDRADLVRLKAAVSRDDARVEAVRRGFVVQETESLDPFDVLGGRKRAVHAH